MKFFKIRMLKMRDEDESVTDPCIFICLSQPEEKLYGAWKILTLGLARS